MPAVVAIDVPTDAPAELVSAALQSCNTALGDDSCQLYDRTAPHDVALHAIVRWKAGYLSLHIELRERDGSGALLDQREVVFSEDDAARLRWASAGLVIASLSVQHERPRDTSFTVPVPRSAPRPTATPGPRPQPVPELDPRVAFDIGVQLGSGLEHSEPRFGPLLGVVVPLGTLPLQLMGSVAYARRSGTPEAAWLSGALGVGLRIGSWHGPWAAELRSELIAEQVTLKAEDPSSDATDETSRVRFGSSLGLGAVWMPVSHFGVVIGAKAAVMRPEIVVVIRDEPRGSVPALGWIGSAGARLQW